MGKLVKARNLATGRDDEFKIEIVAGDASRTELEVATAAEVTTGTDTNKIVTPSALAGASSVTVAAASATVAGKVELATSAETIAVTDQTRAVTPYCLGAALAMLKIISFTGRSGSGAIAVNGVVPGDVVYAVAGLTDMGVANAFFEGAITVDDQIQQVSASNLSAKNYMAFLYGITGEESA